MYFIEKLENQSQFTIFLTKDRGRKAINMSSISVVV